MGIRQGRATGRRIGRTLLGEPLLQFLALGALIFAAHGLLGGDGAPPIDVGADDLERLRTIALRQTGQAPDAPRLQAMAEDWVRQEILYREALALGLDRDDEIIRRRLAQKMEFLASQDVAEPDEDVLQAYFAAHADDYRLPPRVGFSQLYFDSRTTAMAALDRLRAGVPATEIGADTFMLARDWPVQPQAVIARDFGEAFAAALAELPDGVWSGPVASAHGLHLVRIGAREPAALPQLAAVRERVRADLMNRRVAQARDAAYAQLRARYAVRIATPPPAPLAVAAAGAGP